MKLTHEEQEQVFQIFKSNKDMGIWELFGAVNDEIPTSTTDFNQLIGEWIELEQEYNVPIDGKYCQV